MNVVAKLRWAFIAVLVVLLPIVVWVFQFHPHFLIHRAFYCRTDCYDVLNRTADILIRRKVNEIDDWIHVSEDVFVYSAFWDDRLSLLPFIRIVGGICGKKQSLNLRCLILRDTNEISIPENVTPDYVILGENHNKKCKASYFICRPKSKLTTKSLVSLVHANSNMLAGYNHTWLTIRNIHAASDNGTRLGLCVRPFFNWNNSFRIAEFVAYYRTLGVDHFTFYDFDTGEKVLQFIEHLKANDHSVEILPWSLPEEAQGMWEYGQVASIQDCLYRNMYRTSHVLLVDVDEFATPRRDKTLKEVIQHIDDQEQEWNIMYMRSTVFCLEVEEHHFPSFLTQSHISRENYIYPLKIRSKYIIKPKYAISGGIHYPLEVLGPERKANVNKTTILLHHYRENFCKKEHGLETDFTARKYFMDLISSIAVRVWIELIQQKARENIIEYI